jgi:wyosine [tRNA(Phe)-imidazoG37] synthetase (radical SAM superfamily)
MAEKKEPTSYTYGPVPSRRLGLSLGVDIVPPKICTLDCVYCQLGRTITSSTTRADFVDINAVLAEIESKLQAGLTTDYITLGGSGEPPVCRSVDGVEGIGPTCGPSVRKRTWWRRRWTREMTRSSRR